jgi:hypothetical protein
MSQRNGDDKGSWIDVPIAATSLYRVEPVMLGDVPYISVQVHYTSKLDGNGKLVPSKRYWLIPFDLAPALGQAIVRQSAKLNNPRVLEDWASRREIEWQERKRHYMLDAKRVVLKALPKLIAAGLHPNLSGASDHYLPRLIMAYKLNEGCGLKWLRGAAYALYREGDIVRIKVGRYGNRTARYGVVLSTEQDGSDEGKVDPWSCWAESATRGGAASPQEPSPGGFLGTRAKLC